MPETAVETVKPPEQTEQQITETYLEKRAAGETVDLPVPPPTIPEVVPAPIAEPAKPAEEKPAEPKPDVAVPEQQTVDAYIAERSERKRKERGGKQARIDELTKEKAELEERAAKAEEAKAAADKAIEEAKKAAEVKPEPAKVPETLKSAPKMEDFGTDASAYQAALALWVAEQNKPKPVETKPDEAQQLKFANQRKEEFDKFLERGKAYMASHPDFNETLEAAHVRGLTMSEAARVMITRMAAPEVAYWLAKPENDMAARTFMQMDDVMQVAEIGKIAERLHVSPADFVSSAPAPGTRLTGSQVRHELPLNEISDTDEYIRQRKLQRRNARVR